jgi:hypothetical protein
MAIEKRRLKSGKFAYVVRVRRKDRAFFPTKSFQNKSDALEYEAKLRISKGDSGTSRRCQITFGRYVEVWWKKHNFEVSESWKISQRQMLRDYILPELDRLPLAKVDKHNCQSIIERMKRLGRSDQTIRHCYNLMKRIFRCAFELDSFVSSNGGMVGGEGSGVPRDSSLHSRENRLINAYTIRSRRAHSTTLPPLRYRKS